MRATAADRLRAWVRHLRGLRRVWLALGASLVALLVALVLPSAAQAQSLLNAVITGPSHTGVPLGTMSCPQAYTTLETDASAGTPATLPIGPTNFASLTETGLAIDAAPSASTCTVLTLKGTATVLGESADVLVVGQWTSDTATSPVFSILFSIQSVDLSSLVSPMGTASLGVNLSSAWVAVTDASSGTTITVADLPASAQSFLTDGLPTGSSGDLTIAGSGVTFRGIVDATGDLATGLQDLGLSSSGIELDGSLTASVSWFAGTTPPSASAQLSLTASVNLSFSTPSWLSLTNPVTLSVQGASAGTWSVSVSGAAEVTLPATASPISTTASITIANPGSGVELDLSASLGTMDNAFGQTWLTLNSASLSGTLTKGSVSVTLSADATISGTDYTVSATLGSATGLSASLSTTASITSGNLASALGVTLPPAAPTLSLSDLTISVEVPTSGSVTVAATGTASITIGSTAYSSDILIRYTSGGPLLVAAHPTNTSVTLSDLVGSSISPDFTLPDVSVVFATAAFKEDAGSLDPATLQYFQGVLCPSSDLTCQDFTVDVPAGVGISASVDMPSSISGFFQKLDVSLSGPLVVDGQIPLFGGTTTSLTVHLPVITVSSNPSSTLRQVAVSLEISETSGTFAFTVDGNLTLVGPGSGGSPCPQGVTVNSGDVCLSVSVDAELSISDSGVSATLTGSLAATEGWTLPSPAQWLTIYNLTLQLGVTTANGGGLTLGARGSMDIGSTDLTAAIDLTLTPDAPWINLEGFTVASHSGISISDLASLYHQVTGKSVNTSALPPLGLDNLYLSFSQVNDSSLCLQKGFYLSADLVLTNGSTQDGGEAPACLPPTTSAPHATTSCKDDSSCLATVLLSVNTSGSTPAITGAGYVKGWSAGPLSFSPTDLEVTLSSSEVQIDISGGGQLLDPALYASEGSNAPVWASGNLTLDVGTQNLLLDGQVTIGGLSAHIHATGTLSLSDPGFNVTDWFNTLGQDFQTAGTKITGAMDTVGNTADSWYQTYLAPTGDTVYSDIQSGFQSGYASVSSALQGNWNSVESAFSNVQGTVNNINNDLNKAGFGWLDLPTGTILHDALHGVSFGGVQQTICDPFDPSQCTTVTIVPGFSISGLCGTELPGSAPICSSDVAGAQRQFADPAVSGEISQAGLSLPSGATPGEVATRIHSVDPPAPSSITCAMSTADYATSYESNTTLQVSSLGHSVTFSGPSPTTLDSSLTNPTDQTLSQSTLNALYSGNNEGSCTTPTSSDQVPPLTLSLTRSWVHEGGAVTASGYVENSSVTQVSVDWGDGSTSTASVQNGQYSATHTYADETASDGSKSPFTVTASASGVSTTVTQQVSVLDRPLSLSSLTVSPGTVDIMSTVTVTGQIADPESGEVTTATIGWGDGTAHSQVTVGADGTFSATHVYERLVPSGAPSQSEPISVSISEADGTAVGAATSVTVDDVAPKDTTLAPTAGATVDQGTVFTHAGTSVTWTGEAQDISPEAVLTFGIDWADGTSSKVLVPAPTSGPSSGLYGYGFPSGSVPAGPVTHIFASPCLYQVRTTVTDADTLSAPTLTTPVVVTAPLGALPEGPGYWLEQLRGALDGNRGGQFSAARLQCYLDIAQHLSSAFGSTPLTLSSAAAILQPDLGGLNPQEKVSAQLGRTLLTSLLDFANGSWDWTQPVGPDAVPYASLVAQADEALTSGSPSALVAAWNALLPIL